MLVDSFLLTFEELRGNCLQILKQLSPSDFRNPDVGWLHEIHTDIAKHMENQASFTSLDLTNAFYSAVFELEFCKSFYPASLIIHKNHLFCENKRLDRLIRFSSDYPKAIICRYKRNFNLDSHKSCLLEPKLLSLVDYYLVLQKDPLVKRRGLHE